MVAVYAGLAYRYHYRVVDQVTIMQCTSDTFHRELLDERQPLMCSGFENTEVFSILLKHRPPSIASDASSVLSKPKTDEINIRLKTVCPWFCKLKPIQYHTLLHAKVNPYTQCNASVNMHVQLIGTTKLLLVHPHHMSMAHMYTELIVPAGYVVFVPFHWWTRVLPVDEECVYAILAWRSFFV